MRKTLCIFLAIFILMPCLSVQAATFSDVSTKDWFYDCVEYVVDNNLFQGTGNGQFTPGGTMTRGMFVTVLGRMVGAPTEFATAGVITKTFVNMRSDATTESEKLDMLDQGTTLEVLGWKDGWYKVRVNGLTGYIRSDLMTATIEGFTDIPYNMYYAPYISWAMQCGIATGTSSTTFSPDEPITREDICVYLKRYCDYYDFELPVLKPKTRFKDQDLITDTESVYALQQAGIIEGRDTGCFDPTASVKRCEVAALFMRYCTTDVSQPENSQHDGSYTGYTLFGNMAPKTSKANSSYFDDACFIGHSLVVGMKNYFNLPNADYFAVSGISANRMLTYDRFTLSSTFIDDNGIEQLQVGTLAQALAEKTYGKVYIMLGVNELGPEASHVSTFYESMKKLVDIVKTAQPKADIYLISITPIGQGKSDASANFNRTNVLIFNDKLQQVSLDKDVYYLDAFGAYANSSGYMPDDCVTADGIHLLGSKYSILKELILSHAL